MTMKNLLASFKMTGIQPFNKLANALPGECNTTSDEKQSTERKQVSYLLFFAENPMTDQGNVSSHSQVDPHTTSHPIMELKSQTQQTRITDSYTESKLALFQTRYENGYDDRYNT